MSPELGSETATQIDELLAIIDRSPAVIAEEPPACEGWTSAAIAICSILQFANPMVLRLGFDGHEPLLIDFQHRAYRWATPLENFPSDPGAIQVETEPVYPGAAPLFEANGRDLDGLLWMIGGAAFPGQPASWLRAGESYRLTRWPNITAFGITPDEVRMTALLGSGYFTASQLALQSGVTTTEAQRLLNAFSLMGILHSVVGEPEPVRPPAARSGLFRRLRDRLGI